MFKANPRCKVCIECKAHPALVGRILKSKYYMKTKGESLKRIQEDYPTEFTYESLVNHARKHQGLSEVDFTNRHLESIAKKSEQVIIRRAIESKSVFEDVISVGMQNLEDGKISVDTNQLLRAAELKDNSELKRQDQQLAMMEMVRHFASGENDNLKSRAYDRRIVEGQTVEDYDPTAESTADVERRTDQSRAFYQSLAGDAPTPGTD